jgi:hypothetical protein
MGVEPPQVAEFGEEGLTVAAFGSAGGGPAGDEGFDGLADIMESERNKNFVKRFA